ncbi:MAG: hypothetical protein LBT46_05200 [Planctomycetaceae bacterium]|jgi:hypothetical protein|nr:hypothetical protein [Planctomycetaceae bacterium]
MLRFGVFILLLLSASGCICDRERFRLPDIVHPGHISEQQERMKRFDPFTRSDIGPKIEGDRPSGALDQTPSEQRFIRRFD